MCVCVLYWSWRLVECVCVCVFYLSWRLVRQERVGRVGKEAHTMKATAYTQHTHTHTHTHTHRLTSEMVIAVREHKIKLVMELSGSLAENDYVARRAAIDFEKPLVTNIEQALVLAEALDQYGTTEVLKELCIGGVAVLYTDGW